MTLGLRAATVALVMVIGSYGIIGTTNQAAAVAPGVQAAAEDIAVRLPIILNAHWVVADDQHQQVFIGGDNYMAVVNYQGAVVRMASGRHNGLVLSPDSSTLYALNQRILRVIATVTAEERQIDLGVCAQTQTLTGGKLWFLYRECGGAGQHLGSYDPATGEIRIGLASFAEYVFVITALPDRSDRLTVVTRYESIYLYDVSSGTPTLVSQRPGVSTGVCRDITLAKRGDLLVDACYNAAPGHRTFHTADLSPGPTLATGVDPWSVAATPDGSHVAAGNQSVINVYDLAADTPILDRAYTLPGPVPSGGLAFSATNRLFAVASHDRATNLHILQEATQHITRVAVSVPRTVEYQGVVRGTGTLSYPPGAVTTATLSRTDRTGSRELGSIEVAADGTFSFTEAPGTTGPVSYQVFYPGDADHPPARGEAATVIRPLPYDGNADGYAEAIAGAPGEGFGSANAAGMLHVLYGSHTGPQAVGSVAFHQGSPGVPGAVEAGDRFGSVNTSGDFNGDGFADVAVSAPTEDVGSASDAGAVWVFYGSAAGFDSGAVRSIDASGTPVPERVNARYGAALAAGDFDGDGRDELVVGAPDVGAGYVLVHRANSDGVFDPGTLWYQGGPHTPGVPRPGERFGAALATGDVNGDGRDELVIGEPYDTSDRGWATGSVTLMYPAADGLTTPRVKRWSKNTTGVPGSGASYDESKGDSPDGFGSQVELADITGDGRADLVVSAPGAPVTVDGIRKRDAGTITELFSTGSEIATVFPSELHQGYYSVPGVPGHEDHFGATLTSGDLNRDGHADFAIYSPGDNYVTVTTGHSGGLLGPGTRAWTQNSTGIPGTTEPYDWWGSSLRFADLAGTGQEHLLVGAYGENSRQGAFTVIPSGDSGLTGTGARYFSQDTTGIPGTAESGDSFGFF